jgi:hypothetical protein
MKLVPGTGDQNKAFQAESGEDGLFDSEGRRVIRHDPGHLPEVLDQMGAALGEFCALGGNLFRWGSGLARVYVTQADDSGPVKRWAGAVAVHPVEVAHLRELAGRAASHERYDGRAEKYKACDCPEPAAKAYLSRGAWPDIPLLNGFIECPTITLDGRLIEMPGYDSGSGLFAADRKSVV